MSENNGLASWQKAIEYMNSYEPTDKLSEALQCIKELESQLEQSKKEALSAQRDQARYQYLKSNLGFNANNDSDIGKFEVSIKTKRNEAWCLYDEKVDQAIDAAMQEGK